MCDKLPITHPEYGGTLTYLHTLPVGTKFHVCNGYWDGEIVMRNDKKSMLVYYTGEVWELDPGRFAWITILNDEGIG